MNAPVTLEKRKGLTRREVIQLMLDQNGLCGCGCGVKLQPMSEGVRDEHRIPLEQGGSNDLANRELWRNPCSAVKDKIDATNTAKCKRLAGETCTGPSRPIPQRVNPWPAKGSVKIQSRNSFQKAKS